MVRRYEMKPSWECGVMVDTLREDVDGRYVLASDYDALSAALDNTFEQAKRIASERDDLADRLAAAERDAARYRWLIESGKIQHNGTCWFWKPGPPVFFGHDLDAAIDAAMASETGDDAQ